jgi:hypothetical protein
MASSLTCFKLGSTNKCVLHKYDKVALFMGVSIINLEPWRLKKLGPMKQSNEAKTPSHCYH